MVSEVKVFIASFGCASNLADSNTLAGCLVDAGFSVVDRLEDADVVIVNTCAVKGPTENRVISFLKKISPNKKLIVAGCLPLINFHRLNREVRFDGVVGPAFGERIVDVVKHVLNGEKIVDLENSLEAKPRLDLPCFRLNKIVDVIPIAYGCLGECAYCCVRFARGKLRSYPPEEIVKRVKRSLRQGVREIWLCSQDTAIYGWDINHNLPEVLRKICEIKDSNFIVRVGMMRPDHALQIADELAEVYSEFGGEEHFARIAENEPSGGCIFWFLHLPVQSGDNQVLAMMNRNYTVEDFKHVVNIFRNKLGSKLRLSTDVIVGFPGETEEAFKRTLRLIEEVKPDTVNVSKFFPRPRTEAEKMEPKIDNRVIKERSRVMSELALKIGLESNRKWLDWEGYIFVDEKGLKANSQIGRNYAYTPVVLVNEDTLLEKFVKVRVEEARPTYLKAELC